MLCGSFSQSVGSNVSYFKCNVTLCGNEYVVASVCTNGGVYTGDTVLSLYDSVGVEVAYNDDSGVCGVGAKGSQLSYTVGVGVGCSVYVLREYCYEGLACTGTAAVEVTQLSTSPSSSPSSESFW